MLKFGQQIALTCHRVILAITIIKTKICGKTFLILMSLSANTLMSLRRLKFVISKINMKKKSSNKLISKILNTTILALSYLAQSSIAEFP